MILGRTCRARRPFEGRHPVRRADHPAGRAADHADVVREGSTLRVIELLFELAEDGRGPYRRAAPTAARADQHERSFAALVVRPAELVEGPGEQPGPARGIRLVVREVCMPGVRAFDRARLFFETSIGVAQIREPGAISVPAEHPEHERGRADEEE